MARVVPALEARDDVGALREPIDDLALPLVAPLGAHDDDVGHDGTLLRIADVLGHGAAGINRGVSLARLRLNGRPRSGRAAASPKRSPGMIRTIEALRGRLGGGKRLPHPEQKGSAPQRCRNRLDVIAPYMPKGSVGAELGVFKGSFVDYLLETEPAKLYLVDPWYRAASHWSYAKGDRSTAAALSRILRAFGPEIESGQVEPRVEFSTDFLEGAEDATFDWVYIDTTHTYEQTAAEIGLARRKVKPGGYVIGDDCHTHADAKNASVFRALKDAAKAGEVEIVLAGERSQFVARPLP